MAKEITDKRLYCVRTKENCFCTGIEAGSAQEAIKHVTERAGEEPVYDVTCEKIYESSIGTETNGEKARSSNGIFEIKVRGTDKWAVDKLQELIAKLIRGPAVDFEFGESEASVPRSEVIRQLERFIEDLELSVESV